MPKLPSTKDLATKWPPEDTLKIPKYTHEEQSVIDMYTRMGERLVAYGNIHKAISMSQIIDNTIHEHYFPIVMKHDNIFWRSGDMWLIRFRGCETVHIKHAKPIEYVAYLLDCKNEGLPTETLVRTVSKTPIPEKKPVNFVLNEHGTAKDNDGMTRELRDENLTRAARLKSLTAKEKKRITEFLQEHWEGYQEHGNQEKWEEYRDQYKDYCSVKELKDRTIKTTFYESKKDALAKRINLAHKSIRPNLKIFKPKLPALYYHLNDRIKVKNEYCAYVQKKGDQVGWYIKLF